MDTIGEWTGKRFATTQALVQERQGWRQLVQPSTMHPPPTTPERVRGLVNWIVSRESRVDNYFRLSLRKNIYALRPSVGSCLPRSPLHLTPPPPPPPPASPRPHPFFSQCILRNGANSLVEHRSSPTSKVGNVGDFLSPLVFFFFFFFCVQLISAVVLWPVRL